MRKNRALTALFFHLPPLDDPRKHHGSSYPRRRGYLGEEAATARTQSIPPAPPIASGSKQFKEVVRIGWGWRSVWTRGDNRPWLAANGDAWGLAPNLAMLGRSGRIGRKHDWPPLSVSLNGRPKGALLFPGGSCDERLAVRASQFLIGSVGGLRAICSLPSHPISCGKFHFVIVLAGNLLAGTTILKSCPPSRLVDPGRVAVWKFGIFDISWRWRRPAA